MRYSTRHQRSERTGQSASLIPLVSRSYCAMHADEIAICAPVWHELRYGLARMPGGQPARVVADYLGPFRRAPRTHLAVRRRRRPVARLPSARGWSRPVDLVRYADGLIAPSPPRADSRSSRATCATSRATATCESRTGSRPKADPRSHRACPMPDNLPAAERQGGSVPGATRMDSRGRITIAKREGKHLVPGHRMPYRPTVYRMRNAEREAVEVDLSADARQLQ